VFQPWFSDWPLATIDVVRVRQIAIILVAAYVLYRIVRFATGHISRLARVESDPLTRAQREQRLDTLGAILNNLARLIIIFIAVAMILQTGFSLDITPIIAGAGVAGIAVGFGAQSLVRDFFSGFFIILENQFAIGDQVTVAGHTGTVEGLTLRVTTLRDVDGNLHIVPNGKIDTVTVIAKQWARVRVDVPIPYREDFGRALDTISSEVGRWAEEEADALLQEPEMLGIHEFGPTGATVSVAVRTRPDAKLAAGRELRRRIKLALDRDGIHLANSPGEVEPPRPPQ
jgi:small-conductance mechanosensitive channel